jgi:hypothetical protein
MGYYTHYTIRITGADNANQMTEIAEKLGLSEEGYEISDEGTKLSTDFDDKWYGWKDQFLRVSRSYPRVLFEVDGKGEENDDLWKARIRNGESEVIHAKIVFGEFKIIK